MTPAGAVEVGRRVFLRVPTVYDRDEFGQGYMSEGLRLPGNLTPKDLRR